MNSGSVEALTDEIFIIKGKNHGRFPYSDSILISDEKIVLIDTGCGIETLKRLRGEYDISLVINSHTHPDHSAGNWVFSDKPICVPQEGFDTSGDLAGLSERFVKAEIAPFWRKTLRKLTGIKDCRPTSRYDGQTSFNFGRITLRPIHTPGHTKDHYCFYEQREGILFSFDYDLTSFPWYGHRESNIQEFRESVNRLKSLAPKVVVSAHRGIIDENINDEFDKFCMIIDERNQKILSSVKNGKTLDQLIECAPIYGSFPYAEPLLRYWEGNMIEKHLEELEREGQVERRGNFFTTRVGH